MARSIAPAVRHRKTLALPTCSFETGMSRLNTGHGDICDDAGRHLLACSPLIACHGVDLLDLITIDCQGFGQFEFNSRTARHGLSKSQPVLAPAYVLRCKNSERLQLGAVHRLGAIAPHQGTLGQIGSRCSLRQRQFGTRATARLWKWERRILMAY